MFASPYMRFFLLFISIQVILCGCSQDNESTETSIPEDVKKESAIQHGGVYKIPLDINPTTLDPAYIEDSFGTSVAYQLFDGLVQYGPYLSVLPAVAKNWQVEDDGRTIRFFLRNDAYFHHGRIVTAQDVVFSLTRLFDVEPAPSILPHLLNIKGAQSYRDKISTHIGGLVVIDEQQLEIHLTESYAPLLGALAMYQAAIVPEDVVSQSGADFGRLPVGCGPFKFVDWQSDQMIRLEQHPKYYAGPPYLEKIEYRIYPGAQRSRVLTDFKNGLLDEMPVYGTVRKHLSGKENLIWVHRPSLSLLFYGINISHPQLNDPRLRRALTLAINRDRLVETVYKGQFEAAHSVLPPGMPAHNREDRAVGDNLVEAKALVQQFSGSFGEKKLVLEIVSASKSSFAQEEFAFIQEAWAQIGVDIRIRYITDWSEFQKYLKSDSMQIFRYSWTADMPDPDNFLYPLFGSDSPVNYTKYNSAETDHQLKLASGMSDDVQRAQMYHNIEKQVMVAYPIIPLFYLSIDRVFQPNVKGSYSSPLGWQAVRLHRLWLSSPSN